MLDHGETCFENAQQARALLTSYGFVPLIHLNESEHWVRGPRRCILHFKGEMPGAVPLDGAEYVWFIRAADPDDPTILATF